MNSISQIPDIVETIVSYFLKTSDFSHLLYTGNY